MKQRDRELLLAFARAATAASTVDTRTDELRWRLAEQLRWDTALTESGGLRDLSMAALMLSLAFRDRADELDRAYLNYRRATR